ncbi:hypothetical protein [Algoriphagus halophytocola]|uniref:Type IX secretion system membrane protein PorP/SprF n=1 Tax=Algoriphagus halophytocola TaxID=2991499 RepID=A0ABY6MDF4_9BACT|nr:hypothetical protein [Algoriphagus sp. TR-M5]UZD21788.1 hypothetical protein OM944_14065 [Algoriphagus sp. TR-M5]
MKKPTKKSLLLFLSLLVTASFSTLESLKAQGAQKVFNPMYEDYYDSLKNMDYPYFFPILGKGAYSRGYDLQHAWGASAIYFTQQQQILIESTSVGFGGSELVDISDFINFGPTIATTNAYSFRPDFWVLPFVNVYGILGGGTTTTEVTLLDPVSFETAQNFAVDSYGLGITLTGAVGPVWLAWDNNYNFADVEVVVEPVPAFNSSFRVGHTIPSINNPQRNLSVWAGTFFQIIQNDTQGSIPVSDLVPELGDGAVIDRLNEWADGLPPAQRVVVKQIIDKLDEAASGIDPENAMIEYKLDKKVAAPFNLIFGAQYQFNKRWILRSELGVFGKRSQFLLNLNYRIPGIFKTKK